MQNIILFVERITIKSYCLRQQIFLSCVQTHSQCFIVLMSDETCASRQLPFNTTECDHGLLESVNRRELMQDYYDCVVISGYINGSDSFLCVCKNNLLIEVTRLITSFEMSLRNGSNNGKSSSKKFHIKH